MKWYTNDKTNDSRKCNRLTKVHRTQQVLLCLGQPPYRSFPLLAQRHLQLELIGTAGLESQRLARSDSSPFFPSLHEFLFLVIFELHVGVGGLSFQWSCWIFRWERLKSGELHLFSMRTTFVSLMWRSTICSRDVEV